MTLDEYKNAAVQTLEYWLKTHTDAESWAKDWAGGDWGEVYRNSPLHNDYFHFDLQAAVIHYTARRERNLYGMCKCGVIWERGYECCDRCNNTLYPVSIKKLEEWFRDIGVEVTDADIRLAMERDGFTAYRAGVKDVTAGVECEVRHALRQLKRAKKENTVKLAVGWANHIMHVTGNILQDYGEGFGLDASLVQLVSDEGVGILCTNNLSQI